eukprot:symbB.v1.2.008726.t1/scaffold545.1/size189104/11
MVESVQILAGLLGLVGSQGERNVLDFTLDVSKQIIGLWLLTLLGSSLKLSQVLAEATVGVGFEYVLLRSCSLLIFEQILQNKALRTGEYNDEDEEFDPMRYLHQLWIWLLCVCGSQYALIFFQLPSLCGALLQVLLAPFDWIDLEGPTMLVLCCLCRAFQFRLTDVLVLRRGGLAAPQAAALLTWGACAAAQAVLGAIAAVQVPQCEVIKSSSTKRSKKIQREGPRKEQKDCEEQPAEIAQHDIAQVTPEKKAEGIPVDTPPKEVLNTKCQEMAGLVKKMESLANLIPHLEKILRDLCPDYRSWHLPKLSINQLDSAVASAFSTHANLESNGYPIGRKQYQRATSSEFSIADNSERQLGGRPSLINSKDTLELVQKVLEENVKDSERVLVIGRGSKKRMVLAKHLMSTRTRLWRDTAVLNQKFSLNTFKKLLAIHFPYVRNPRRDTDVCKHCKHFSKYILPSAKKAAVQAKSDITVICPTYFAAFDASPLVQSLQERREEVEIITRLRRYIDGCHARQEPADARPALSLTDRISLHAAEATGSHILKGHIELLDAYVWHQISQRRQGLFASRHRTELPDGWCLVQMDYKENVKYPMGPNETSEEWHAQNKLSLTVFGANVLAPKKGGGHVEFFLLLVSDILDHDAQAANMSANTVLQEVRKQTSVDWGRLRHLLFVTDCGPHFRSKENAAHFCYTLPLSLRVTSEVCWLGEQHGKSGVDRCFGWCNEWISSYIQRSPIHNLGHLIACFQAPFTQVFKGGSTVPSLPFTRFVWRP